MIGDAIPLISVIIPTIDEEALVASTIASARTDPSVEVIVVDGGSRDGTVVIARERGCRVIESAPGRGIQMNVGSEAASGVILLFLHADTILPQGYGDRVREKVTHPGVAAGAFRLRIDSEKLWGLRWIERIANWRSRYWQMPFGDQAIFLRADLFREIGGCPHEPLLEDVALIHKLRSKGKIILLDESVLTSPRRWEKLGVVRTTLINQMVLAGYFLGFPPHQLAQWYLNHR